MTAFISAGFDPRAFWHLTPREVQIWLDGAALRLKREQTERAWLAWTTAALMRSKKMPKLATLIDGKKPAPRPRQTWQEQLAIMEHWAAAHNAKFGKTPDG